MRSTIIAFLLALASLSFSIQLEFLFDTGLANATAFEPFNNKFYVINDFDGRIYVFDSIGALTNKVKAQNLYIYDIDSFNDKLIYISDLGVYQLKPSVKELSRIYGFNSIAFNDKFYVFGTVYHALTSYTSNFSFVNKIGGVKQPDELIVKDVKLINNTLFVSDIYRGRILIFNASLHKIDECNLNISTFEVLNGTIVAHSNHSLVIIKNCSIKSSLKLDNVKDIEQYNGEIYVLVNSSIYKLEYEKVEEKEEVKEKNEEVINQTEQEQKQEKEEVKEPVKNETYKDVKEEKQSDQLWQLAGVAVFLLFILAIIYIFLRPKKRYRRKK